MVCGTREGNPWNTCPGKSEIHAPFQKLHGDIYNSLQQDQTLNMEHMSTVFGNTKIITGGYKIVR